MANEIQFRSFDNAPPSPTFFDYAAQFLQSYQNKKEEMDKSRRAELIALLPTLASKGMVELGGPIEYGGIPGGLGLKNQAFDLSDLSTWVNIQDKLGLLPEKITDKWLATVASSMVQLDPKYLQAEPEDRATILTQTMENLRSALGRRQASVAQDMSDMVTIIAKNDPNRIERSVPRSYLENIPNDSYEVVGTPQVQPSENRGQGGPSAAPLAAAAGLLFGRKALAKAAPFLKTGVKAGSTGLSWLKNPIGGARGQGFTMSPAWNPGAVTPAAALGAGLTGYFAGDLLARAPLFGGKSFQEAVTGELPSALKEKSILGQLATLIESQSKSTDLGQYTPGNIKGWF